MAYAAPEGYFSDAARKSRFDKGTGTKAAGGGSFQDYSSGSSDSDFLDRVYQNETGRASDADGKSYWQGQLDAGFSREDIISGFNASEEGKGYDAQSAKGGGAIDWAQFQADHGTSPGNRNERMLEGAKASGYELFQIFSLGI